LLYFRFDNTFDLIKKWVYLLSSVSVHLAVVKALLPPGVSNAAVVLNAFAASNQVCLANNVDAVPNALAASNLALPVNKANGVNNPSSDNALLPPGASNAAVVLNAFAASNQAFLANNADVVPNALAASSQVCLVTKVNIANNGLNSTNKTLNLVNINKWSLLIYFKL
jgi:hypothetical protein